MRRRRLESLEGSQAFFLWRCVAGALLDAAAQRAHAAPFMGACCCRKLYIVVAVNVMIKVITVRSTRSICTQSRVVARKSAYSAASTLRSNATISCLL